MQQETTNQKLIGYSPVYAQSGDDAPPARINSSPKTAIGLTLGLMLGLAGVGSLLLTSFQQKTNMQAEIDRAVREAIAQKENQVASCVNKAFESK
ncbi:hypothetical protein H6G96_32575 [Nostoc sp. FACHB-892]|uniref:hypothetical protein n=1 Tax=Nostoc sp. FACHB-892 TaxID=2692843 RepID=UPI001688927C|nr:hypothetical protein [Nostoc sp. FACHB-892]MBD2730928.1 hypothetical protein [Nostoc sp. FACHB-892]